MPPWVRHQFPEVGAAGAPTQGYGLYRSRVRLVPGTARRPQGIEALFGFDDFRPKPPDNDGNPMQGSIVEAAMAGEHVLGILPTGTGKPLCYQIPALSRYDKIGALTVVISPLVALMADQVAGLEAREISSCVTVNGLLSMPERADALDRVRPGHAAVLLVSPEQLRSRALRRVLDQREIGGWVLDEAHCLSRWGHDFRPDYRYVGRFIREKAGNEPAPPVLCLTATAKPDVTVDIVRPPRPGVPPQRQLLARRRLPRHRRRRTQLPPPARRPLGRALAERAFADRVHAAHHRSGPRSGRARPTGVAAGHGGAPVHAVADD